MIDNKVLSFDDENITPQQYITLMFERTDEDGVLYIPWTRNHGYESEVISCRCRMNWNLFDYESVLKEYEELYNALKAIASVYNELSEDSKDNLNILKSDRLFSVWNTYIRNFEIPGFDYDVIDEIGDRYVAIADIKNISKKIAGEESVDDYERSFLKENLDVTVSNEEAKLYKDYWELRFKDAEKRVGSNICAHYFVVTAMRLCKLMSLGAPKIIVDNEARQLASAMVIHKFAVSKEDVSDSIRYNIEKLESMTDEELDEYYRPKKTNTRKSMAPLYVYKILQKHSSSEKHMRQQDILKILSKYPYEITMERKALSRILHNMLDDTQLQVFSDNTGVWIDNGR